MSADYLASEECAKEMQRALERARTDGVRVVPILLRPCFARFERLAKLEPLPADRRPVTVWPDRDAAWTEVVTGIANLVGGTQAPSTGPHLVAETAANRIEAERIGMLAKLEDARVRRRRLESAGVSTREIDDEILALKRGLREGGQLRQGDLLGGRYSLLRRLGRGGFATVWEAEDRDEHARVAVKILHAELAGDVTRRERFFRGARIMREIGHDAIVRILASEQQDGGYHYFVMELLTGGDLHAAVLKGEVPAERVVPLILRVGSALTAAHEHTQRFIHRDVKPANVLLDAEGNPKLSDFDLVGGKETTGGTRTGAMGSFVYAAPEMLSRPQEADARADVFGLGMTALFCLHGKPLTEDAFYDPKSVLTGLGRPAVSDVIAMAIERKAERRFGDVRSFCAELQAVEENERLSFLEALPPSDVLSLVPPREPSSVGPSPASPLVRPPAYVARGRPSGVLLGGERESALALDPPRTKPAVISRPPKKEATKGEKPNDRQSVSGGLARRILAIGGVALMAIGAGTYGVAHGFPFLGWASAEGTASTITGTMPATVGSAGSSATPHPGESASAQILSDTRSSPATSVVAAPTVAAASIKPCPSDPGMMEIAPAGLGKEWQAWIGSKDGIVLEDERPRVSITLRPYCMDRTEVTVAAYSKCVATKNCAAAPTSGTYCKSNRLDRQNHPINCVSWDEASTYCQSLGNRLPTEEEWEFAARGPEERVYPWGSAPNPLNQLCWDGEGNDLGRGKRQSTCPVASYPEGDSPFGLSDTAGNVWEWTSSLYCGFPHGKNCSKSRRVVRGGSWNVDLASNMRATNRGVNAPTARYDDLGFRCAKDM